MVNAQMDPEYIHGLIGSELVADDYLEQEAVYRQGDPADEVFYILAGKVRITVVSDQGKEGVIGILEAGDFIGEGCLTDQPYYLATAAAMTESQLIRIDKPAMKQALRDNAEFSRHFMTYLLSRNVNIEADLVDQLFNSSEKRLARVLLLLANFGKEDRSEFVIPAVSQELLAARVGTTRSRINVFMNKFRRLGFIEYNGDLKIHPSLMNVIIHD